MFNGRLVSIFCMNSYFLAQPHICRLKVRKAKIVKKMSYNIEINDGPSIKVKFLFIILYDVCVLFYFPCLLFMIFNFPVRCCEFHAKFNVYLKNQR